MKAPTATDLHPMDAETATLASLCAPHWQLVLERLERLVNETPAERLEHAVLHAFSEMDTGQIVELLAAAFALAELKGLDAATCTDTGTAL